MRVRSPAVQQSTDQRPPQYRLHLCPPIPATEPRLSAVGPSHSAKPEFNPLLNPEPGLLVASIPNYNFILNRYPTFPHHFFLCTSKYIRQTLRLADEDVVAAYSVLKSWEAPAERLFCFANSTPRSGSSYKHRHIQFYPIAAERALPCDALPRGMDPTVRLHPQMPFRCFCMRFTDDPTAAEVAGAYRELLKRVQKAVGHWGTSYNMGLTKEWMVLAPRLHQDGGHPDAEFNGTVLAGDVVVRGERDWAALRDGRLEEALKKIGVGNRKGFGSPW